MSLREYLASNKQLQLKEGLYSQNNLSLGSAFEQSYLSLREKEGRLYSDDFVRNLPYVPTRHPLAKEWKLRKYSADKLIRYLKRKNRYQSIIEIGCGNGWLTNYVAQCTGDDCLGVDINIRELQQAARLFHSASVNFAYADIQSDVLKDLKVDVILLPSCLQYFRDARNLLFHLAGMLRERGEIHVLDTPIYKTESIQSARERSEKYFSDQDGNAMSNYYHHHDWEIFKDMSYDVMYNPGGFLNKVKVSIGRSSPFAWVRIGK